MSDFWLASGHHLCDRADNGRVIATPDLWRACADKGFRGCGWP